MSEKIVITGMGAVTPIGNNVDKYWESLTSGVCGISHIEACDTEGLAVTFAGEVKGFDADEVIGKKLARDTSRFMQFAFAAAKEAIEQSGVETNSDRVGIIMGTALSGLSDIAETQDEVTKAGKMRVSPRFIPKILGNIAAAQISIAYGTKGPSLTINTACSSGGDSISTAATLLRAGQADVMIAVGGEAITCPLAIGGLSATRALSTRNDNPKAACRPFDTDRDGFVMGEGGGALVLETESHALKRGATILCELAGYASNTDAYHITSPHPEGEGAARCMAAAIKDAGISPEDIGYINAHGTSTKLGDIAETNAIKKAFGNHAASLNISSTKSATGHLMGAGGITETIACIMAVREGVIPPTLNLDNQDPECDLNYTANKAVKKDIIAAMNNSFGFGGQNSSLIVKKYMK